jgi:hypothetical protein
LALWVLGIIITAGRNIKVLECVVSCEISEVLMIMDQSLRGLYGSVNGLKLSNETQSASSVQDLVNAFKLDNNCVNQNYVNSTRVPPDSTLSNSVLSASMSQEGDSHEDFDFSDVVLKYISQMLMEEEMEDKTCMFQESSAALLAAEQSLYELIG